MTVSAMVMLWICFIGGIVMMAWIITRRWGQAARNAQYYAEKNEVLRESLKSPQDKPKSSERVLEEVQQEIATIQLFQRQRTRAKFIAVCWVTILGVIVAVTMRELMVDPDRYWTRWVYYDMVSAIVLVLGLVLAWRYIRCPFCKESLVLELQVKMCPKCGARLRI